MGLLDELKKLTKTVDDEDYLEEDLADPIRGGRGIDSRAYAAYAEPPRAAEQPRNTARRPYVFAGRQQQAQPQPQPYAQPQQGYAPNPYGAQPGYPQPEPYVQPRQNYAQPQPQPYAQPNYGRPAPGYGSPAQPQAKLLLVRPDRFEVAADIADRIAEKNAVVLNLEYTQKETTRRLLDFLSGVTYALNGNIKKVSGNTYIITPAGMDFMGEGLEEMSREQQG